MKMSFNGILFEDLNQRLKHLGKLLSIRTSTKDDGTKLMEQEARIHAFMTCHTTLNNLFRSIYEDSELSKKPKANPKNAPGEVLTMMLKEKVVTKEQVGFIAQQYEVAGLLTYDDAWLLQPEDRKAFKGMVQKIPRYYYGMNMFVANLSKRLIRNKKGK